MKDNETKNFINYYECDDCGTVWSNQDEYVCDDKCPDCGNEIQPYRSEDVD
jgi:predicted  nucleic acid-binding Zn-ribbon protein